jgi:hypothetical protein
MTLPRMPRMLEPNANSPALLARSRRRHTWMFGAILGLFIAGCGGRVEQQAVGGETHWLSGCTDDTSCGADLECLCGRCTRSCDEITDCGGLSAAARCLDTTSVEFGADCNEPPPQLCARAADVIQTDASSQPEQDSATHQPQENQEDAGAAGCDTLDTCATQTEVDATTIPAACTALDPTQCAERSDCYVIRGQPYSESEQCFIGSAVPLGCRDAMGCLSSSIQLALDADGQCFAFDGCAPEGFVRADAEACTLVAWPCVAQAPVDGGAQEPLPCSELTPEACSARLECRLLLAEPYDAAAGCYAAMSPVGCADAQQTCPAELSVALDADGACYRTRGCVPPGLTQPLELPECTFDLATSCAWEPNLGFERGLDTWVSMGGEVVSDFVLSEPVAERVVTAPEGSAMLVLDAGEMVSGAVSVGGNSVLMCFQLGFAAADLTTPAVIRVALTAGEQMTIATFASDHLSSPVVGDTVWTGFSEECLNLPAPSGPMYLTVLAEGASPPSDTHQVLIDHFELR